jgi:TonB family protein
MNKKEIKTDANCIPCGIVRLFQVISVALVLALSLTASAAGERAIKSRVPPVYPELAKRMKIMGVVKVEATVDAGGNVTEVKTIDGNRMLSPAAEEAVKKWKFESGDGVATVQVELKFALAL